MKYFLDTEFLEGVQANEPSILSFGKKHNALSDAKWNFELYKFLNSL